MKMRKVWLEEEQKMIESVFSKGNIRHILEKAVEESRFLEFSDWFEAAIEAIEVYRNQKYSYSSKNKRILNFVDVPSEDLAMKVAVAVFSDQKAEKTPSTYQQIAGYLSAGLSFEENVFDSVKTAAELLAVCAGLGLYDIEFGSPHKIKRLWELEEDVDGWINDTTFTPPMVCKPMKVKDNSNCGYLEMREPLLVGGRLKQHDEVQAYDVVNMLNSVEWQLDKDVLREVEVSSKPLDTEEKEQNFLKQTRDSHVIYDLMLSQGNKFYLCWQYDTRGRLYSHGYHINLQSFEYKKALLNFSHKEVCT